MSGELELTNNDKQVACQVKDISISALSITTDQPPAVGDSVVIDVPGLGVLQARVSRVSDGTVALNLTHETSLEVSNVETLARALR